VIAEGEVMQLAAAKNTLTTEDEYLAVDSRQDGGAVCRGLRGRPGDRRHGRAAQAACRGYGLNLGIAFQLIDDALDYGGTSSKLGKNVGDDFREGKITLPVVLSFRRGSDSERAFWRNALEARHHGDEALQEAIAIMRRHRAIEDTVERARHYGAMARDALALFAPSDLKHALLDTVEFCLSRAH
jgi:octaprenyl-diphosphate synthase